MKVEAWRVVGMKLSQKVKRQISVETKEDSIGGKNDIPTVALVSLSHFLSPTLSLSKIRAFL